MSLIESYKIKNFLGKRRVNVGGDQDGTYVTENYNPHRNSSKSIKIDVFNTESKQRLAELRKTNNFIALLWEYRNKQKFQNTLNVYYDVLPELKTTVDQILYDILLYRKKIELDKKSLYFVLKPIFKEFQKLKKYRNSGEYNKARNNLIRKLYEFTLYIQSEIDQE